MAAEYYAAMSYRYKSVGTALFARLSLPNEMATPALEQQCGKPDHLNEIRAIGLSYLHPSFDASPTCQPSL